jgi:isopentenyl diphosphate isomerase/L-lactate dehydrogenase-like FMN-dependent dehydrogenase
MSRQRIRFASRRKRLRDRVKAKLVLKGILAFDYAKLAADVGIDAINTL